MAAHESPYIFTHVRSMSKILSVIHIIPIASAGIPATPIIKTIATRLADGIPATPIEVKSANSITVICMNNPMGSPPADAYICDMNTTAAHSYSALPFIFTVAPKGRVNPDIFFGTRAEFSTHSSVTGRVAMLDEVENAVRRAGNMARICLSGGMPHAFKIRDIVINMWTPSDKTTVAKNANTGSIASAPALMQTGAVNPKTPIGRSLIIIFVICSNKELKLAQNFR